MLSVAGIRIQPEQVQPTPMEIGAVAVVEEETWGDEAAEAGKIDAKSVPMLPL